MRKPQFDQKTKSNSNTIPSYPILSYPILSYFVLSYLVLSYFVLSYLVLSYLVLSYFVLSYPVLSYLIVLFPTYSITRISVPKHIFPLILTVVTRESFFIICFSFSLCSLYCSCKIDIFVKYTVYIYIYIYIMLHPSNTASKHYMHVVQFPSGFRKISECNLCLHV